MKQSSGRLSNVSIILKLRFKSNNSDVVDQLWGKGLYVPRQLNHFKCVFARCQPTTKYPFPTTTRINNTLTSMNMAYESCDCKEFSSYFDKFLEFLRSLTALKSFEFSSSLMSKDSCEQKLILLAKCMERIAYRIESIKI